jgi:hypothetical protein
MGNRKLAVVLLAGASFAACGGVTIDHPSAGSTGAGSTGGAGDATSASATTGSGSVATATSVAASSSSGGAPLCVSGPNDDADHDGFTVAQGDCNDCDAEVNPGAVEVIDTTLDSDGGVPLPIDDDCDGIIDNVAPLCDTGLALADADPLAAAHAIDICKASTGPTSWGLVSAAWVLADGAPLPTDPAALANYHLGHGLLGAFGPNNPAKVGKSLLVLSSGTARRPGDPGYQSPAGFDKGYPSGAPPGFPLGSPSCPGVVSGGPRDAIALDIHLRAPSNVEGVSFNFSLFSRSWPQRVCSAFDDQFMVLQTPPPLGAISGDISYDAQNHPLTLNSMLLEACSCAAPPCFAPPTGPTQKPYDCPSGPAALLGNGFDGDAGTGWLTTRAPVKYGDEFSLRFALWDGEDGLFDTTVLVDGFAWIPYVKPPGWGLPPGG